VTLVEIVTILGGQIRDNQAIVRCPVPGHGKGRGDMTPSMSIGNGSKGHLIVHCHAGCDEADIWRELALLGIHRSQFSGASDPPVTSDLSEWARKLWRSSGDCSGTPVELYLHRRGVAPTRTALRYLPRCRHPRSAGKTFPAMIAAFSDETGHVRAIQRTYLTEQGHKAQLMPGKMSLGAIGNSAIRLFETGTKMGIAEGVESALSAQRLFGVPVWAAGGSRMDRVQIPTKITELIVFADHDAAGALAANRAYRSLSRPGLKIEIVRPVSEGADWNEVLLQGPSISSDA